MVDGGFCRTASRIGSNAALILVAAATILPGRAGARTADSIATDAMAGLPAPGAAAVTAPPNPTPANPARRATGKAQRLPIVIPPATLDGALMMLARQTGVEIVSTESGLRLVRTAPVEGRMPVRAALARLLHGSGYRAVAIAGGGFRVVRVRRAAARAAARPVRPPDDIVRARDEIVVTASKQRIPLLRYPGSLTVVEAEAGGDPDAATGGTLSDATRRVPILQSTQLGLGRNKVFIRGVADSSFNGSTQSPTSVYLDDVQVNYSGPEPGLRLYDMRSVEVLEGPQGTLYGSGAIGGVIRLTSNPVVLDRLTGWASAGATATLGASPGFDMAGVVNVPLVTDTLGVRMVGYRIREGGFIDDRARKLTDINRSDTAGGRIAMRLAPGDGWRIEASAIGQWIDTRDGQYSDRPDGRLSRRSRIAQPFDNELLIGRLVASKEWTSGLSLVVATGVVGYASDEQFDVSPRAPAPYTGKPAYYRASHDKLLVSQETRLARSLADGRSWVLGFTWVSDRDALTRRIGVPDKGADILGVTNVTEAASLFGETTFALMPRLSVTAGGRLTSARTDGTPSSRPKADDFVKGRETTRFDPTIAASWALGRSLALFARFQTGYRTGGLAVAQGVGRIADFKADSIEVWETGLRKLRNGPTGLAASGSVSFARWNNVQADLITDRGQPYTDNIGDARIEAVEGNIDWVPMRGLRIEASFLFTDNEVTGPIATLSKRSNGRLPETPAQSMHGGLSYGWAVGRVAPRVGISIDYVGRSVLGTGDFLDIAQGDYWVAGLTAEARIGATTLTLAANNLTDRRANQFAFGNPFTLGLREQLTPLRPLNVRLGVTRHW